MPRTFNLTERIGGFAARTSGKGEPVHIFTREALTSLDGETLTWRLEWLHGIIFSRIPDLPLPSQISNLLIDIAPDLQATAYVNELEMFWKFPTGGRPMQVGDPVYVSDLVNPSIDLGVQIPPDHALVVFLSFGWRQILFYDFGPLNPEFPERNYDLSAVLAGQTLSLLTGKFGVSPPVVTLQQALADLEGLLRDECKEEARYQELLEQNPLLLGGVYTSIERHTRLDDRNIPDFTGVCIGDSEGARDLIEIKQSFMQCFRKDGGFNANFNAARSQAESYLTFVRNNKDYLRNEKGLVFSNPCCILLVGWKLSDTELRKFRELEAHNRSISVLTYEQVLRQGLSLFKLLELAAEPLTTAAPG